MSISISMSIGRAKQSKVQHRAVQCSAVRKRKKEKQEKGAKVKTGKRMKNGENWETREK